MLADGLGYSMKQWSNWIKVGKDWPVCVEGIIIMNQTELSNWVIPCVPIMRLYSPIQDFSSSYWHTMPYRG